MLELQRNVVFGQFVETGSVIHRMDPRIKLAATFVMLVASFVIDDFLGFAVALALLAPLVVGMEVLAVSISVSTTDNKNVCGGTEQTGLRFYSPNGVQKRRAPRRVFEPRVEIWQDPGRTLDPYERFDREARLGRFVAQLLGEVEVSGREPLGSSARVTVLPFADVALDDLFEAGIFQEASQ